MIDIVLFQFLEIWPTGNRQNHALCTGQKISYRKQICHYLHNIAAICLCSVYNYCTVLCREPGMCYQISCVCPSVTLVIGI